MAKKIALLLNDDFSMWHFRGGLIKALVGKKYEVTVLVPPGPYCEKLRALGAKVVPVAMHRFFAPLHDLKMTLKLRNIFNQEMFDIVHNMTIKPNIFGTFAAKLAGIPRIVCLVSGAGFIFDDRPGVKARVLRIFGHWLYRLAFSFADKVWFQNPDDLEDFMARKIVREKNAVVIRSGGIDIEDYSTVRIPGESLSQLREELSIPGTSKCIVMVTARLIWSKGVREFVEAAEALRKTYPEWVFIMLCPREDDSPDSVPQKFLDEHKSENLVLIDSFREDSKHFIALADIVVLVSYYREGVPRTLLEALALGKPVITSLTPGCKEVVKDGINGFLIPPKDTQALVDKIQILMESEGKRHRFGMDSKLLAEQEFSESLVVDRVISELYEVQNEDKRRVEGGATKTA